MKIITLVLALFCTFMGSSAQQYSISNISFDTPFGDTLMANEKVQFTFDYTKPDGAIRIFYYPYGSGKGGAQTSGSKLFTENKGKVEGFFTMNNDSHITSMRIYFREQDGTQLYDTTVTIDYTYIGFNIDNLVLDPPSATPLSISDSVKFTFDYSKPDIDIIIHPRGEEYDELISKQVSPKTQVLKGTKGSSSGYIQVNEQATLDILRFQFLDASSNDTLFEHRQSVFYSFSNDTSRTFSIYNVEIDPPSPALLKVGDTLNISFDYKKPFGDIRIYGAVSFSEGNGNVANSGSPLYTDNIGKGSFRIYLRGEGVINKLLLLMKSNYLVKLHEHTEDIDYTVVTDPATAFNISNVKFYPPPPVTVNTVDTIKLTYDYQVPFGGVQIFARPFENGELKLGYTVANSDIIQEKSGSGNGYIVYPQPSSFDQVRFQIKSNLNSLLYETFVDAKYKITVRPVYSTLFTDSKALSIYPNPASEKVFIETSESNSFYFRIVSLAGQVVEEGYSNTGKMGIDLNKFSPGTYITHVSYNNKQFSKLLIFE